MRILGLVGSLRRESHNRRLLVAAERALPDGVRLEIHDDLSSLPPYDEDATTTPAPVARLREAIAGADAVLVATPEYNSSVPGHLKNAMDWASRPFPDNCLRGRPVAVVGASAGVFGAVWAQAELRKVLGAIGARVLDRELPVGQADDAFTDDGDLADPDLRSTLHELVGALIAEARVHQPIA